jgi:hypothetical protein
VTPLPLSGLSRRELEILAAYRRAQRLEAQRLIYAIAKDEVRIRRALAKTP